MYIFSCIRCLLKMIKYKIAYKIFWEEGMDVIEYTMDQEVMAETRGYCVRFAKVAARFRKELMEQYGSERGSKIRYTEAYVWCVNTVHH